MKDYFQHAANLGSRVEVQIDVVEFVPVAVPDGETRVTTFILPKGARIGSRVVGRNTRKPDPKALLEFQMKCVGLPVPDREYRFATSMQRNWRFDYAFPSYLIAVEFEGLVVRKVRGQTQVSGRHATITGMREDMVKYNSAILLGWSVLRFEQTMVASGVAIATIQQALAAKGWPEGAT